MLASLDGQETILRVLARLHACRLPAPNTLRRRFLPRGHAAVLGDLHRASRQRRIYHRRLATESRRDADISWDAALAATHHIAWPDRCWEIVLHAPAAHRDGGALFLYGS